MRQALPWILLLASNLGWGAYVVLRPAPDPTLVEPALPAGSVAPSPGDTGRARAAPMLERAKPSAVVPTPSGAAQPSAAERQAAEAEERTAAETKRRLLEATRAHQEAIVAARTRIDAIKADILQITDPARREAGLGGLQGALRSDDPVLAAAALRSLFDLRDAAFDKALLRPLVLARLDDPNPQVRPAALYALMRVPPEAGDLERVLTILEGEAPPSEAALHVATMLSKNRVEGRLATAYVRALEQPEERSAIDVANLLRGMWVTPEVEDAVLATWRRTKDGPNAGPWNHILGQIEPTREPRVRVIFEILRRDQAGGVSLLARALSKRSLDPEASRPAVELALEGLGTAPNAAVRRLMIDVIEAHGQAADATRLRAFADNPMVADELRTQAHRIADGLR